ncbi:MAG: Type 1 glutamine amidotransferase-like domain-containing protein [Kineosporiaceae bacterium]
MPADVPTILASSGGWVAGRRTRLALGPLVRHAVDLAGVAGRAPRVTFVGTAGGDQAHWTAWALEAAAEAGVDGAVLSLFPMPNVDDLGTLVHGSDVVWVNGGSVANLLAVWRVHGLDRILHEAWRAGVVLGGVSAGSLCWHVGGTTDSFGPDLRAVTDALGFLPYGNGVHYDSEAGRRPLLQRLVADGTLPLSYATDDGAGIVYRGTEPTDVVTERDGAAAYRIEARDGRAVETRLDARRLR